MAYLTQDEFQQFGFVVSDPAKFQIYEQLAERVVDSLTGFRFEEFSDTIKLDGSGWYSLYLPFPLISVSSVKIFDSEIALDDIIVYSDNDWKYDPKIAFKNVSRIFPVGNKNIEIEGTWGFVDVNGNTPLPIKYAIALLVNSKINNVNNSSDILSRLIYEKTDLHAYKLVSPYEIYGSLSTGILEVDNILEIYRRRRRISFTLTKSSFYGRKGE